MRKLFRFYCVDCDNAWIEILNADEIHSRCEYCDKLQTAETID
jgi:hypothetical protein